MQGHYYVHGELFVPAQTSAVVPALVNVNLPNSPVYVNAVRVKIPSGHAGFTGFAMFDQGTQLIPYNAGDFIVADDEIITFDCQVDDINTLTFKGFNLDVFGHTFYLTIDYSQTAPQLVQTVQTIPIS
jgi:hypothetical protein